MNADALTFRVLTDAEQPKALPLLGRCFKEAWENIANTCAQFPIYELSFAALDGSEIVGHCGLIPYTISDGQGARLRMGGIGSVATDPQYRGRGIASSLCRKITEWCKDHPEYKSLPLYTSKDRVYESVGWTSYIPQKPMKIQLEQSRDTLPFTTAPGMSADGCRRVQELYANGEDFFGKVIRGQGNGIQDWPRILKEKDYFFVLQDGIYALLIDNAVAELYADSCVNDEALLNFLKRLPCFEENSTLHLALPRNGRVARMLGQLGIAIGDSDKDLMHGEHPMALDLTVPGIHGKPETIFYPLADKF